MSALPLPAASKLQPWFWFLLLLNAAFIFVMHAILLPFQSAEVIQLETAKTSGKALALIDNWSATGKLDKVYLAIALDYIFIVLYVTGLMVAVLVISDATRHPLLIRSGRFFRWLIPAAGICDFIENFMMHQTLKGAVQPLHIALTYDMAVTKFSILIVTLLFIVLCLIFWSIRKLSQALMPG